MHSMCTIIRVLFIFPSVNREFLKKQRETRIEVNCYVTSILLYVSEYSTISSQLKRRFEAEEM